MSDVYSIFSKDQRNNAIQRLTALWAFTESGLGGIMHALKIPFTGLIVGGMAVVMICLIAEFSENKYRQILKCAIVVLIVKAMAAPFTPFTAYIAVSFQALIGFLFFSLLRVNFISILLLSAIAMVESAMQKLLMLTLFFGTSLWKAMDKMIAFASDELGHIVSHGSYWIIGIYLGIYVAGGLLIAWFAYSTIKNFDTANPVYILKDSLNINTSEVSSSRPGGKSRYKKLWLFLLMMIVLSAILFFFTPSKKQAWFEVLKTISWTLSALLIWFVVINPLLTKVIQRILKKKQSRYSVEVAGVFAFLPVLKRLAALSWQQSKQYSNFKRWHFFITALIYATLTYSEPELTEQA